MKPKFALSEEERTKRLKQSVELEELQAFQKKRDAAMKEKGLI
jgi:hypothetical protein